MKEGIILNIIICLDNNNGMMFNNRRLSMDKALRNDILKTTSHTNLFMNNYSYEQFSNENSNHIIVSEDFLEEASKDDYCFVEDKKLCIYFNKIEQIIIYKWNRIYPSDFKFDIDLKASHFKLIHCEDFEGNSHNKISKEVYNCEKL